MARVPFDALRLSLPLPERRTLLCLFWSAVVLLTGRCCLHGIGGRG